MRFRALLIGAALMVAAIPEFQVGHPSTATSTRSFRLFAIGYKQTMPDAESYETFRASIERRFAQIAPLLAANRPNVVVFPEATGLTAWLIGMRGEQARRDGNTAVSAVASLAVTYAPQVAHYESKCGVPPPRALVMALTDTTWRAVGETFAELAKRHGVYVSVTTDIAPFARTTDPAKVQLLADPELDTDYAYEALCSDAFNANYFFAPTGRMFDDEGNLLVGTRGAQVRGVVPKAYLVPIERDQSTGLALSSASPSAVRPVDLGLARFGSFISKDAWMSDVVNRNDVDGAEVFLQPEAGAWAGWSEGGVEDWPQDGMHRALWGMVQKLPDMRWGALSNLIGNFHDLPFDGTPTITTDASDFRSSARGSRNRRHYLLGRRVTDGIVARSRWVVPDPGPDIAFSDLKARRNHLQEEGAKRAPGSGAAEENAYVEDAFVWADIRLSRPSLQRRVNRGPFSAPRPLAEGEGAQWEPSLAATRDGTLVAAWTDLRNDDEDAFVARFDEKGWSDPVNAGPDDRRPNDQQDNQYGAVAAIAGRRVHVVWLDFRNQSWDVRAAAAPLGTLAFSDDARVDNSKSSGEGYPNENLHNDPVALARRDGTVVAAWDDLRRRNVDRDIAAATLHDGSWKGDVRASRKDAAEQFHPDLAEGHRGNVWVVWQDHRHGDGDVRAARSKSGRYSRPVRVDDGPPHSDAFHPRIAFSGSAALVVWSDDRTGAYQIRMATGRRPRRFFSSLPVDPTQADQSYSAVTSAGRRKWVVAWTDERAGDQDVVVAAIKLVHGRLRAPRVIRVDDSGSADARLPALAFDGERIWVAWEEMRSDLEQIRVSSAPVSALF